MRAEEASRRSYFNTVEMSDPLSIPSNITSLLKIIALTTSAVVDFVRICRQARGDLLGVSQELSTLTQILEWVKSDIEESNAASIPDPFAAHVGSITSDCNRTLDKIRAALEKHSTRLGPARWALDGKKEVNSLQRELCGYRGVLALTLETISL